MADDLLRPLGANVPSAKVLKAREALVTTTTQTTNLQETRLAEGPGAVNKDGGDDEGRGVAATRVALPEFQPLEADIERAIKKIGRSVNRLLQRLDRLEDRLERITDRFEADLSRDIRRGFFEDRTPDRAVSRFLDRLERVEGRAERITQRFYADLSRAIGRQDADGLDQAGISVEVSQSLVLSVERLEINVRDDGRDVSISYQRIAFSISSSVGLTLARPGETATDATGAPADVASADQGLFVAQSAGEDTAQQEALAQLTSAGGEAANDNERADGDDGDEGEDGPAALPAEAASARGYSALLLLQQFSFSSSTRIESLVLGSATRLGPTLQGNPLALPSSSTPASSAEAQDRTPGVKLNI